MEEEDSKRKGLANFVKCTNCGSTLQKYTFKTVQIIGKPGMQSFDVNLLSEDLVLATGIKKICGMINMPPPMTRINYDKLSNKIWLSLKKSSTLEAAPNLKQTEGTDAGVSGKSEVFRP